MQKIINHLWFDKEAVEAAKFYTSVFSNSPGSRGNSKITNISQIKNTPSGDCDIVSFELNGQPFMAISAGPLFKFNEAISFVVSCENQEEIDYFWGMLSAVPESEQCGWLKDKFGLSWQIVPTEMNKMMSKGSPAQIERVTKAFLKMKKIDVSVILRQINNP